MKGAIMNKKGVLFSRNTHNDYNSCYSYVNSTKNIAQKSGRRSQEERIIAIVQVASDFITRNNQLKKQDVYFENWCNEDLSDDCYQSVYRDTTLS